MVAAPTPTGGAATLIDLREGDAADPLNASIYLGSPRAIAGEEALFVNIAVYLGCARLILG